MKPIELSITPPCEEESAPSAPVSESPTESAHSSLPDAQTARAQQDAAMVRSAGKAKVASRSSVEDSASAFDELGEGDDMNDLEQLLASGSEGGGGATPLSPRLRSLRRVIWGVAMAEVFLKYWVSICVVVAMFFVNIVLYYIISDESRANSILKKEVLDRRYKALTISSELHERTLSSQLETQLNDSSLRPSNESPYRIVVPRTAE